MRREEENGVSRSAVRDILGVRIVDASAQEALDRLDDLIARREKTAVAFANANLLNIAHRSDDLRAILSRFVVFNDGIGVDIASRILHGARFKANMNGTDFVPFFIANSRHALRVFLFGGRPEVAEAAARAFGSLSPTTTVCGFHHGYVPDGEDEAVLRMIDDARPDVVLVALGNPRQERWIASRLDRLDCVLAIGVGALFDFMSGTMPRAPSWVRQLRVEWMYRLMLEPRRLANRYVIGNGVFLARVGRQRFKR